MPPPPRGRGARHLRPQKQAGGGVKRKSTPPRAHPPPREPGGQRKPGAPGGRRPFRPAARNMPARGGALRPPRPPSFPRGGAGARAPAGRGPRPPRGCTPKPGAARGGRGYFLKRGGNLFFARPGGAWRKLKKAPREGAGKWGGPEARGKGQTQGPLSGRPGGKRFAPPKGPKHWGRAKGDPSTGGPRPLCLGIWGPPKLWERAPIWPLGGEGVPGGPGAGFPPKKEGPSPQQMAFSPKQLPQELRRPSRISKPPGGPTRLENYQPHPNFPHWGGAPRPRGDDAGPGGTPPQIAQPRAQAPARAPAPPDGGGGRPKGDDGGETKPGHLNDSPGQFYFFFFFFKGPLCPFGKST